MRIIILYLRRESQANWSNSYWCELEMATNIHWFVWIQLSLFYLFIYFVLIYLCTRCWSSTLSVNYSLLLLIVLLIMIMWLILYCWCLIKMISSWEDKSVMFIAYPQSDFDCKGWFKCDRWFDCKCLWEVFFFFSKIN